MGSALTPPSPDSASDDAQLKSAISLSRSSTPRSPLRSPLLLPRLNEGALGIPPGSNCMASTGIYDEAQLPDFTLLPDSALDKEGLSVGESVFNLVNTMVGSGVLSVPYAFKLSGYVTLFLLIMVVMVTAYTAQIIGTALDLAASIPGADDVPRHLRDYVYLARVTFGRRGQVLVGIATILEMWIALVTFVVMNAINSKLLFQVDIYTAVIVSVLFATIMVYIPMRAYSYISLLSLLAVLAATAGFGIYVLSLPWWAYPSGPAELVNPMNIPRSVGILVFCFAGHPCFPMVHGSMQDTGRWAQSVGMSFLVAITYYGSLGMFAFVALGHDLAPCFTINISSTSTWHSFVIMAFVVKVQLTAPLLSRAILVGLQLMPEDGEESQESTSCISRMSRFLGPILLSVATIISACTLADDLAALASLCGSLLVMLTSVMLPIAFFIKLRTATSLCKSHAMGFSSYLLCLVITVFALVAGASGTYYALFDLIHAHSTSSSS